MCQPGKFKKVILQQSNDVLSSQLPCVKMYSKEELIVPNQSSLFGLYKPSGTALGLSCKVIGNKDKNGYFPYAVINNGQI